MLAEIVERVLLSDHDPNSVSTGHRSVRLHPIDRSGPRPLPHGAARRRAGCRAYVGRARRAAAPGVRPRHPRSHHRLRRGRAHGDRDLVELGLRARRRPTLRPAVRLRSRDPRRHRCSVPARPRRRLPRRRQHRHASPGPLGRRTSRGHHRHRLLRTDRRLGRHHRWSSSGRSERSDETRGRKGARPRHRGHHPRRARLPLRRLPRGVGLLPRPCRGPHPRPALPHLREGLRPAALGLSGRRHADQRRGGAARTRAPSRRSAS